MRYEMGKNRVCQSDQKTVCLLSKMSILFIEIVTTTSSPMSPLNPVDGLKMDILRMQEPYTLPKILKKLR